MASEIGKIVHCKICGTPIVAKGNRLFCPVCYNQNRRNAAQRSNARTKVQREQMKREEEKMKQNNCAVTSAAGLNMQSSPTWAECPMVSSLCGKRRMDLNLPHGNMSGKS